MASSARPASSGDSQLGQRHSRRRAPGHEIRSAWNVRSASSRYARYAASFAGSDSITGCSANAGAPSAACSGGGPGDGSAFGDDDGDGDWHWHEIPPLELATVTATAHAVAGHSR